MKGNIIVGQSGGPTAAINSSLAGVYRTAIDRGAKKVYGMRHGIQGLLNEDYIDLSEHIQTDVAFRAKCKMFSRHLQKPILKTEKGRFKGL